MDTEFTSRIIEQRRLDPCPVQGFRDLPDALFQTMRWRRQVERYSWGMVIFASDREEDLHFSAVIEGKVDLATGKVTMASGAERRLPDWYAEMADYIAKAPNRVKLEVPKCLGQYTPDERCDGGPSPEGLGGPCTYRQFCIALQEAARRENQKPFDTIRGMTDEEKVELAARLVQKRRKKRVTPPNEEAMAAVGAISKLLMERLYPRSLKFSKDRAAPGDVFTVEKTGRSGYITIYCRAHEGRSIPILSMRIRKQGGVDLQLPLPADHPLLEPVREFVVPWRDRSFLSAIKRVPGNVTVEQACDVVMKIIESNIVQLPPLADV
jgi:hypothetical protein